MRRVMIGTPSYDGRCETRYAHSLAQTVRMGISQGIEVREMLPQAVIQEARNEIVQLAVDYDFDDLVWIDADQDWEAADFFKLLAYPVDCVGVPVRRKDDSGRWNVKAKGGPQSIVQDEATGLWTAPDMTVGCGMLRMSKRAVRMLWDGAASLEYKLASRPRARFIFHYGPHAGNVVSEDLYACEKLIEYGVPIYIDPTIRVGHTGAYRFTGDFFEAVAKMSGEAFIPVAKPSAA